MTGWSSASVRFLVRRLFLGGLSTFRPASRSRSERRTGSTAGSGFMEGLVAVGAALTRKGYGFGTNLVAGGCESVMMAIIA